LALLALIGLIPVYDLIRTRQVAVQPRPKSLRSLPPPLAAGSLAWPAQRWEAGTPAITWLTC
jgi:hypothetical protein